jgi:signal transduction histidine kinase
MARTSKPWRLYIAVLLCSVLPLVLFVYAGHRVIRSLTIKSLLQQTGQAANLAATVIEDKLKDSQASLQSLAQDPSLTDTWISGNLPKITARLQEAHELKRDTALWAIYDTKGILRASAPAAESQAPNFADSPWFKQVAQNHRIYISGVSSREAPPERSFVTVASPIMKGDQFSGVLAVKYDLNTIKTWLAGMSLGATKWISVVDQNGFIVVAPARDSYSSVRDVSGRENVKKVIAGQDGTEFIWQDGKQLLTSRHPISSLGWGVLVEIPVEEIDKFNWRSEGPLFWVASIFVLLALAIGTVGMLLYSRLREGRAHIAELNAELSVRIAELESRNKELEAFSYSVSHDVRAPLRHIAGFSQLLLEECQNLITPDGREYLQEIQHSTRRLQQLVEDLLRFSKLGAQGMKLQVTNLNDVVGEVVSSIGPELAGRKVTFDVSPLPSAECDRALIKQVFLNLIANAVKFTATRENAVINIGEYHQGGESVMYVRDNGVGFDMKHADRLFEPFHRLHSQEQFEGTGIGLAMVQRIIMKHHGRIWAESESDHGASFFFSLSRTAKPEKADTRVEKSA